MTTASAQERHQEPVRLVPTADRRAGRDPGADRHDPIKRRDEIRVHDPIPETKPPVDAAQRLGQIVRRALRFIYQNAERREHRCCGQWSLRLIAAWRNSVLSWGSVS